MTGSIESFSSVLASAQCIMARSGICRDVSILIGESHLTSLRGLLFFGSLNGNIAVDQID